MDRIYMLNILTIGLDSRYINLQGSSPQKFGFGRIQKVNKLISRHCLEKIRTRWNDFLFLITDDRDFRPQTCTNDLVFRECKHIKNIFEDVFFSKNLFHFIDFVITLFIDMIY
jgi:hypothetical protein